MPLKIHMSAEDIVGELQDVARELFETWAELMAQAFQAQVLPAFRRVTPQRTGALRMSLYVILHKNRIGIGIRQPGENYYRFVPGLVERYEAIFAEMMARIIPQTIELARRKVLG